MRDQSGTSPAKNTITYTHHSVTSSSRRQDSSEAGTRRSWSAFWRQNKISTNIYGGSQVFYFEDLSPTFGRGPGPVLVFGQGPGPVLVPASLSWTSCVTPFCTTPRKAAISRSKAQISKRCFDMTSSGRTKRLFRRFDYFFQCLLQGGTKGLNYRSKVHVWLWLIQYYSYGVKQCCKCTVLCAAVL